ncbi:hypothetical protein [Bacillus sp. CGMCC 1.16541]|uniref:hypothetical protein n=1 Tax=Bacillus sp. CGMCC 1.16541 TaxID=2185143 RepID=UPI000D7283F4|nr:hypothetical protein [Bacillus sp. CGMCC 1.16541]
MYTYESFETLGAFTLMRPIFMFMFVASFVLFVLVLLPRFERYFNGFLLSWISILSIIIAVQLIYYEAIIVDEIGLGGDATQMYMFLAICGLNVLTPIVYRLKKKTTEHE